MSASRLFTPLELGGVTLPNRVVVAPMCQYSAEEGVANAWHQQHLGSLSISGAGLVMIEATGVERDGRITLGCLGLWNDVQEQALDQLVRGLRPFATARIGIQIGHAGRKGSSARPWEGGSALTPEAGAWPTIAPSALPHQTGWPTARAMDEADLARIKRAFVASASRALRIGLDAVELHCAHAYLLHQFLSPISNHRTDGYGGSLAARMRFPLEVAEAVRQAWPRDRILGARITGTDWIEGGWTVEDAVAYARELKAIGFDYVCVSSGGFQGARVPVAPGYQVALARAVRAGAGIATRAVGLIVTPAQAEAVVAGGDADLVALARGFLDDPRWAWHAADALGADIQVPPASERARPRTWPGAALARTVAAAAE